MELDFDDVVTSSEYMQLVSSGYLEDTTNTQADLVVNAQVTEVRERIYILGFNIFIQPIYERLIPQSIRIVVLIPKHKFYYLFRMLRKKAQTFR